MTFYCILDISAVIFRKLWVQFECLILARSHPVSAYHGVASLILLAVAPMRVKFSEPLRYYFGLVGFSSASESPSSWLVLCMGAQRGFAGTRRLLTLDEVQTEQVCWTRC